VSEQAALSAAPLFRRFRDGQEVGDGDGGAGLGERRDPLAAAEG
jgi:hypothetical protein